jgi:NADPH:quinone reductase-like Zn-dependent oxidoreductase
MKAIAQYRYGRADVLDLVDLPIPQPGPDEVLVRVSAAGVDAGVWHLMTGLPYAIRLLGPRRPKVPVRGREFAGEVDKVGAKVTEFRPGDKVFGIGEGTFAEYAKVPVAKCLPMPANASAEQMAIVPISAATALRAVRDAGRVKAGQRVLVIGAGGGVGSFAVQLAKALGATVTGVCSTAKVDLVRSLGADEVIDYTTQDIAGRPDRFDVILDIAGNRRISHLRRALTPRGTLVIVGGEDHGTWLGMRRQFLALLVSPFVRQNLRVLPPAERKQDLRAVAELVEAGKVRPAVDRAFPLSAAPDAIRYWESNQARGKAVVTIWS